MSKGKQVYSYSAKLTKAKTSTKGRFYNQYVVDEAEYRKKKRLSLNKNYKQTKQEKYKEHRDNLLYAVREEMGLSLDKMAKFCKLYQIPLKKTQIYEILSKKNGKNSETPKNALI